MEREDTDCRPAIGIQERLRVCTVALLLQHLNQCLRADPLGKDVVKVAIPGSSKDDRVAIRVDLRSVSDLEH